LEYNRTIAALRLEQLEQAYQPSRKSQTIQL